MAIMAYMYAKGQKSGQIKGGVTQKGREDSIGIIAVSHQKISWTWTDGGIVAEDDW